MYARVHHWPLFVSDVDQAIFECSTTQIQCTSYFNDAC